MPQKVTILGATGSIGQSTLAVLAEHPALFEVEAVTAATNVADMLRICAQVKPKYAVMTDASAAQRLASELKKQGSQTRVASGIEAVVEVAQLPQVDTVMAAIVGAAGLLPTLSAVNAGKRVLLANKEALVMSGQLFMQAVAESGAQLLPVDSEHNAIFQCLPKTAQQNLGQQNLAEAGIAKILLTGSGGPFREIPLAELAQQTPSAACAHPNWSMGQKISVDSATMLNKGLEYIEARWLFNCQAHELEVVLHPQSVIHSMVSYHDGSVLAQMGQPDMRTPIAHCLSYPQRISSGVEPLNFTKIGQLTFDTPEPERFPCLYLAKQACWQGQWATTTLNAANEQAVAAFLQGQIQFGDIHRVCDHTLSKVAGMQNLNCNNLDEVLAIDKQARHIAQEQMEQLSSC